MFSWALLSRYSRLSDNISKAREGRGEGAAGWVLGETPARSSRRLKNSVGERFIVRFSASTLIP